MKEYVVLVDISEFFFFFFGSGAGKREASEQVEGGGSGQGRVSEEEVGEDVCREKGGG